MCGMICRRTAQLSYQKFREGTPLALDDVAAPVPPLTTRWGKPAVLKPHPLCILGTLLFSGPSAAAYFLLQFGALSHPLVLWGHLSPTFVVIIVSVFLVLLSRDSTFMWGSEKSKLSWHHCYHLPRIPMGDLCKTLFR